MLFAHFFSSHNLAGEAIIRCLSVDRLATRGLREVPTEYGTYLVEGSLLTLSRALTWRALRAS